MLLSCSMPLSAITITICSAACVRQTLPVSISIISFLDEDVVVSGSQLLVAATRDCCWVAG